MDTKYQSRLGTSVLLTAMLAFASATDARAQARLNLFDQGRLIEARAEIQAAKMMKQPGATKKVEPIALGMFKSEHGEQMRLQVSENNLVGVVLTVSEGTDESALEEAGLKQWSNVGNHYFGKVNIDDAERLAACPGVVAVSLGRKAHLLNDLARQEGRLNDVQAGTGLPQAYNGKGVVVGLMDMGLDPNHVAFIDAEGNTRVKRLWQYSSQGSERSYTDENISRFSTDAQRETHGTHVLGIMAGSCITTEKGNDFHGVAPEADIAISCGDLTDDNILAGVKRIADYAKEVGKPCVINLSLGTNIGPHDGTDPTVAALNELGSDPNTNIFMASGNEGSLPISIVHTFSNDAPVLKTMLSPTDYSIDYFGSAVQALGYIDVWSADERPVKVYFDLYQNGDYSTPVETFEMPMEGTAYEAAGNVWQNYDIPEEYITENEQFGESFTQSLLGGITGVEPSNNRYCAQILSQIQINNSKWCDAQISLRVEGEPGQTVYVYTPDLYIQFANKNKPGFTAGGGDGCISNLCSGKETISVGSYCTRNLPDSGYDEQELGTVSYFTSWGTLADGRELPDFCAPGQVIISAESYYYYRGAHVYDDRTRYKNEYHFWYNMAGTSMATPYAAGVGALLLSVDPTLTTDEIRNIMKATATPFTTKEVKGGAGKLNAYEAVKYLINTGGVSSVTDNARGGISIVNTGGNSYEVLAPNENSVEVMVSDMSGMIVLRMSGSANGLAIDLNNLAKGIYAVTVSGGKSLCTEKVAVK